MTEKSRRVYWLFFWARLAFTNFIWANVTAGVITVVISIFSCGTIMGIIGVIEGIIYLSRTDEQFAATYVIGKKEWF